MVTLAALRLAAFAMEHDGQVSVMADSAGGMTMVSSATDRDRMPCTVAERVPATRRAVFDALGY